MHRSLLGVAAIAALAIPTTLGAVALAATDTDGDGVTNDVDSDDDNDGVDDLFDIDPLDPYACEDTDNDGADDCSVGVDQFGPLADNDPNDDGPDCDADGIVDATDPDDDNDGVPDEQDAAPCDPDVSEELVDVWAFVLDDLNGNGQVDIGIDQMLTGWTVRAYTDGAGIVETGATGPVPPPPPLPLHDVGVQLGAFPAGQAVNVCTGVRSGWVAISPTAGPSGEACLATSLQSGADAELFYFLVEEAVTNQPPTADAGGPYLVAAGADVVLDGTESDDPDGDSLGYAWSGGTFDDPASGTPTLTAPDAAGIYEITLTIDDGNGGTDDDTAYVVVYDPDGGFVTGGGWIDAPRGSCLDAALCAGTDGGSANFGFVAKYQKGKTVPSGQTAFTFESGALSFHSTSYRALVVNGASGNAQYWGAGTIAGEGSYDFKVWTSDGDVTGCDDTFRIQIRRDDGTVVFDNGNDQPIAGGQISIHVPKGR